MTRLARPTILGFFLYYRKPPAEEFISYLQSWISRSGLIALEREQHSE